MKHCVCAEKSIIIAQGLPESPHHVLGNLWIKIAGWFKRSGLSKHKQSGLTNVVDWLWFALHLGQLRGLAVFSEQYLGVFFLSFSLSFFFFFFFFTYRNWNAEQIDIDVHVFVWATYTYCSLDIWCTSSCFSITQYDLCYEPLLVVQRLVCRRRSG